MERFFKVVYPNGKNESTAGFLVPINATAPYSNDISTFLEDSDDYVQAEYYGGKGGGHRSYNILKTSTTTHKPFRPPLPGPRARDIFGEDNYFYQHVFNFTLVIVFLLQVLLIWAFLIRRRRSSFRRDLEAIQVQFHAAQAAGGGAVGVDGNGGLLINPVGIISAPAPAG